MQYLVSYSETEEQLVLFSLFLSSMIGVALVKQNLPLASFYLHLVLLGARVFRQEPSRCPEGRLGLDQGWLNPWLSISSDSIRSLSIPTKKSRRASWKQRALFLKLSDKQRKSIYKKWHRMRKVVASERQQWVLRSALDSIQQIDLLHCQTRADPLQQYKKHFPRLGNTYVLLWRVLNTL